MTNVRDIFNAQANGFGEMMLGSSGTSSLKVPEYQRPYDWDMENVHRLLQDCLNGLKQVVTETSDAHYTFLGTIILATDADKEPTFGGESKLIVDGQQRLTTLILLSCSLFETLRKHRMDLSNVSHPKTKAWLQAEFQEQSNRLYACSVGQRQSLEPEISFPRLVRCEDLRGHTSDTSSYQSAIAFFLREFGAYCVSDQEQFTADIRELDSHLMETHETIGKRLEEYVYSPSTGTTDQIDEFDPEIVTKEEFGLEGCKGLFVKLHDAGTSEEIETIISYITEMSDTEGIIRLLLFSSYVVQSVVLAVVEARNEELAFDIFDALNTTGEPLTALETLKPHVVRFERDLGNSFAGSETESSWSILEENVINANVEPDRRQKETKELIIGFALYHGGQKVSSELNVQGITLRRYFSDAKNIGDDCARHFVSSIAKFYQFRKDCWDRDGIDAIVGPNPQLEQYNELKLCLRFIADMKTSTIIPILARYWIHHGETESNPEFQAAAKAVTAFLALRRAMTGGTAGIDSEFRQIMSQGRYAHSPPLCVGQDMTNEIFSADELRFRLRQSLAASPFNVSDKPTWLNKARVVSLAQHAPRALFRFLILAAAHHSVADNAQHGLLTRQNVVPSDERGFFNHAIWVGSKYSTIEHVAPVSASSGGWEASIYNQPDTRERIGNLVLLPEKENQTIGNAPWPKKRLFYRALAATTRSKREKAVIQARNQGLIFGKRAQALIENRDRLHMLDPVADLDNWTAQLIHDRTDNILDLAWDQIAPWLFD